MAQAAERQDLTAAMTKEEIYENLVREPADDMRHPLVAQAEKEGREISYELPFDRISLPTPPTDRLVSLLPDHLLPFFDRYLYVSKAPMGLWAQQMFVYEKDLSNRFSLTRRWLCSTGRERQESYFTTTPEGLFKLDPDRFFERGWSSQWNASMPWAMFYDYSYATRMSGLAIHAAARSVQKRLGTRASGGCVRLFFDHAKELFISNQNKYAALVPEFLFIKGQGTSRRGEIVRKPSGEVSMVSGFKTLLIVDDFTI